MTLPHQQAGEPCTGSCHECDLTGKVDRATLQHGIAGWRMVWASTLVFLLPLLLAIAGALAMRQTGDTRQLIGAAAGLAAGVVVAAFVVRFSALNLKRTR